MLYCLLCFGFNAIDRAYFSLLNDKPYALFSVPFEVRLYDARKSTDNADFFTVVQPDLCVICDPNKLDEQGAIAAP